MHLQESGEMYLETIYILSQKMVPCGLSMSVNTWDFQNPVSAGRLAF